MKISVNVKTHNTKEQVIKTGMNAYTVCTHAHPINGKANMKVQSLLSKYLNIPKSRINIIRGHTSKKKIVEFF